MDGIREVSASEAWELAGMLARREDQRTGYILGNRDGPVQRRMAYRNSMVTSSASTRILTDGAAWAHVCAPGSWPGNLHEFILRGCMKIPFVVTSETISRLEEYRDACLGSFDPEGLWHVAAAYGPDGGFGGAADLLSRIPGHLGAGCFCVPPEGGCSVLESAGYVRRGSFQFGGTECAVYVLDRKRSVCSAVSRSADRSSADSDEPGSESQMCGKAARRVTGP